YSNFVWRHRLGYSRRAGPTELRCTPLPREFYTFTNARGVSGRFQESSTLLSDAGTRDALLESLEIQGAASREGFDWPSVGGVLDKVEEEIAEIREALAA